MKAATTRPTVRVRRATVALMLLGVSVLGLLPPASAHSPHDVVVDVEPSPAFARDNTVFAIVREHLLESRDGGDTWKRLVRGLDNRFQLRAVEVSALDEQVLYVGTLGDGVYRSADGGQSWTRTRGAGLTSLDIRSLAISPGSSDVLFGTIAVDGTPVVVRTEDGGASWRAVPQAGPATVVDFATDDPTIVISGSDDGTVRLSRDGGTTWDEVLQVAGSGGISALAATRAASSGHTVFVGTHDKGLLASTDDARTFAPVGEGITDPSIESVALSPDYATDQALWVSTWTTGAFASADGGATWTEQADGLTTNVQADELGRSQFGPLRVAQAASGADPVLFLGGFDGLFRSTKAGAWHEVPTQVSSNVAALAISPAYGEDQTLAVATYLNGALLSADDGSTWEAINGGLAYEHVWTRAEDYYARLVSISFSPTFADDRTLFAAERGYVLRSQDAGGHWSAQVPEDLLVAGEQPPDYTLWAFSPDYARDQTIILGSSRGKILRSTDGGRHFDKIGQVDAPVAAIVTSPAFATDHTLIVGTAAGVQRSTDSGRSWAHIGPFGGDVTSLAIAPDFATSGRILAGTMSGLFATTGKGWTPIPIGPDPAAPIEAVAFSPELDRDGIVLASARGRGLFRSTDGGSTFAPVGSALLADNVVLGNFYHRSTDAIVFSPAFARDHTVFGIAGTSVYRSTDSGSTWTPLVLPISTHDTDVDASPDPLLPIIEDVGDQHAADDGSGDAPLRRPSLGDLVLAAGWAAAALGAMTLVRHRAIKGRHPFASVAVRAAASVAVLVVALVVLAG